MTVYNRARLPSLDHGFARFLRMAITGAIGAAILSLIAWYVAEMFQGASLMVMPPGGEVTGLTYGIVLAFSLIFAVGAALVYWIVDRTSSPMLWFFILSAIVFALWVYRTEMLPDPVTRLDKNWSHILHVATTVGIWWAVLYVRGWFPIRERG